MLMDVIVPVVFVMNKIKICVKYLYSFIKFLFGAVGCIVNYSIYLTRLKLLL